MKSFSSIKFDKEPEKSNVLTCEVDGVETADELDAYNSSLLL